MLTSETLNLAADLIQQRGWTQGVGWWSKDSAPTDPLCLEGAIQAAVGSQFIKHAECPAYTAVRDYLTTTRPERISPLLGYTVAWAWNDAPERTQAEVIEVLRATAVIEAARENETAQVTA